MSRTVRFALAAVCASFVGFLVVQPGPRVPARPLVTPGIRLPAAVPAAAVATESERPGERTRRTSGRAAPSAQKRAQATALLNRLPARFEKIEGSNAADVSFLARGYGRQLLLSCDRAVLTPQTADAVGVTMYVEGGSPCHPSGNRELPGRTNYLLGNDSSRWRTDVRSYERAAFPQVYPGIDLVYYGAGDHLEYDFVVSPGADPSAIALRFAGTDRVEIDADGALVLHAPAGELRQHAPAVYQQIGGERRRIEGRYVMRGEASVGFALGSYDRAEPLTIDPVLIYSSYLGTPSFDIVNDVALDSSGNIYLIGETSSTAFPTLAPYQPANAGGFDDLFIVKLNPGGTALLYATYLGGNSDDIGAAIAIGPGDHIFISGYTTSSNFPSAAGSYVFGPATSRGLFAAKLSADGSSLAYVAKIAAEGGDIPDVAVDAAGEAYVVGSTPTVGLPVPNAAQPACAGAAANPFGVCEGDAYLFKLNAAGSALVYATYIGGGAIDTAKAVAIDTSGAAYVVGQTNATDFPIAHAFQPTRPGGGDAFLTVVSPSGSTFTSSSYLGGSAVEVAQDVAVHSDGSVAIVGFTASSDFPELHPAQPGTDGYVFVTKLDSTLTALVFSTHLGGPHAAFTSEWGEAVAFDSDGAVYVGGYSRACGFPSRRAYPPIAYTPCNNHPFVASYSPTGTLRHSMMVGGENIDHGLGMTIGPDRSIYLVGNSSSTTFPTINPFQSVSGGQVDGVVMRFAMALEVTGVRPGTARIAGGDSIDISGLNFMAGATVQLGGGPAIAATFVNPTLIRAVAPAHAPGPVSITVNNPDGESTTKPNALQYSACTFSLSSYDVTFSLSGGIGSVDVHNDEGSCSWTAGANDAWLQITSASSGIGNGHLTFAAAAYNQLNPRTATLTIAGRTFTVTESGFSRLVSGDFTGDGVADLSTFRPSDGRWTLAGQPDITLGTAGDVAVPADYDGDGIMDRAVYRPSTGEWIVEGMGTIQYGLPGDVPVPGRYQPYTPNIAVDLAVFRPSTGRWYIRNKPAVDFGRPGDLPVPADYSGILRTDIAVFRPSTGEWFIQGTAGSVGWGLSGDIPVPADYDGDYRADVAVFRPSTGSWYVRGQFVRPYGRAGDVPMPLDYDGDRRADVAVYRPSSGLWFIDGRGAGISAGAPGDIPAFFRLDRQLRATPDLDRDRLADVVLSQGSTWKLVRSAGGRTISSLAFGMDSDQRRVADFDGDGRADLVLFRAATGNWYVTLSSAGYSGYTSSDPFGAAGDLAVPADYDGDGLADRAFFRPSTGRWSVSTSSGTTATIDWGAPGDIAMAEDADGDGRADLIVFRPSTGRWYIRAFFTGGMTVFDWGLADDIPVPADYDGDGRIDIAVFRPSTAAWWILGSAGGYTTYTTTVHGQNGDVPAPADYDGDGRADLAVFRPSSGEFLASPAGLLFTASPGDTVVKHQ